MTPDQLIGAELVYRIIDYGNVRSLRAQYTDDETYILANIENEDYLHTFLGDERLDDQQCFVLEYDEIRLSSGLTIEE